LKGRYREGQLRLIAATANSTLMKGAKGLSGRRSCSGPSEPPHEGFITAVEVKHYAYCPRIVWFTHVLHLNEPITEAMRLGAELHDESFITPLLRRLRARKVLRGVELESPRLRVRGRVDYVMVTGHGEYVPVEVKWSDPVRGRRARRDHRLQLATYALLMEEATGRPVKQAAIYYARAGLTVLVNLTEDDKEEARRAIRRIHEMVETGEEPEVRVPRSRCLNCGFRRYCSPG